MRSERPTDRLQLARKGLENFNWGRLSNLASSGANGGCRTPLGLCPSRRWRGRRCASLSISRPSSCFPNPSIPPSSFCYTLLSHHHQPDLVRGCFQIRIHRATIISGERAQRACSGTKKATKPDIVMYAYNKPIKAME